MKTQTPTGKTLCLVLVCLILLVGCSTEPTEFAPKTQSSLERQSSNVELQVKRSLPPARSKPENIRQEFWVGSKVMHYSYTVLVRKAEANEPHFEWHAEVDENSRAFAYLVATTPMSDAEEELSQLIINFANAALDYDYKLDGIETERNRFVDLETLRFSFEELEQIVLTTLYETEKLEQYY